MLRGVRGATTVEDNTKENIEIRSAELLDTIVKLNHIELDDIGAVIFSSTPDIDAAFPARGVRALGWNYVPLFGTQEIDNPQGLQSCVRVLILWNTDLPAKQVKHVYLHDAQVLRPDLV